MNASRENRDFVCVCTSSKPARKRTDETRNVYAGVARLEIIAVYFASLKTLTSQKCFNAGTALVKIERYLPPATQKPVKRPARNLYPKTLCWLTTDAARTMFAGETRWKNELSGKTCGKHRCLKASSTKLSFVIFQEYSERKLTWAQRRTTPACGAPKASHTMRLLGACQVCTKPSRTTVRSGHFVFSWLLHEST